jgi:hypothetical protein
MKTSLKPLMSSTTGEHYTPPYVVALVQEVLGEISLDPCSDVGRRVPAKRHFTECEDGLRQDWNGSVFLNPPYGRTIESWTGKLLREFDLGHVTEAIALVPARTDTAWFQAFVVREVPVCLVRGRLRFSEVKNSAPFPSALLYLGQRRESFIHRFSVLGPIVRALPAGL